MRIVVLSQFSFLYLPIKTFKKVAYKSMLRSDIEPFHTIYSSKFSLAPNYDGRQLFIHNGLPQPPKIETGYVTVSKVPLNQCKRFICVPTALLFYNFLLWMPVCMNMFFPLTQNCLQNVIHSNICLQWSIISWIERTLGVVPVGLK